MRRRSTTATLLLTLFSLSSCGAQPADEAPSAGSGPDARSGPVWAVDPKDPGDNLPPVGRSLFDYLVTERQNGKPVYKVPFPFATLLATIERRIGTDASIPSPLKRVLIPLNRSLQRHAARPDFFAYPRAVAGVDAETPTRAGAPDLFLKDRLFLGYQEKANIIEVISYNEAAGRFEFQVVRDYRPGGVPQVLYANRAVCTVCHQNQSPIFARPLWDETNANPKIAALLHKQRRDFYGFPIHQGVDVPNALDDATDRANEFSAVQLVWQDGCERAGSPQDSVACRADLTRFLLQYHLSGSQAFDHRSIRYTERFAPRFLRNWEEKWPKGLLIPNPDIVNRNPLDFFQPASAGGGRVQMVSSEDGRERVAFRSQFEPSVPRGPLATWSTSQARELIDRLVIGLSRFLAEADVRRLDARLFERAARSDRSERRYEAACRFTPRFRGGALDRLTFHCTAPDQRAKDADGSVDLEGAVYLAAGTVTKGAIDHLTFEDGDELVDLAVARGRVVAHGPSLRIRVEPTQKSGLHARRGDGHAIATIAFHIDRPSAGDRAADSTGRAIVAVWDDFSAVHHAVDVLARETLAGTSDVLARKPFRRAAMMEALSNHLGLPRRAWCCTNDEGMPEPVADVAALQPDPDRPMEHTEGVEADIIPALKSLRRYCGKCHEGRDAFPPNFLHGSPAMVQAQVSHCAERIFFRLEMWRLRAPDRLETPMPPANALRRLDLAPEQWTSHADLAAIKHYAADLLQAQGKLPRLEDFVAQGYDRLQECLPETPYMVSGLTPEPAERGAPR